MNRPDSLSQPIADFASPAQAFARGLTRTLTNLAQRLNCPPDSLALVSHILPKLVAHLAEGHTCLPLQSLPGMPENTRQLLFESGLLMAPDAPKRCPLVLDAADRLYLYRYFDYEQRLRHACIQRQAHSLTPADPARVKAELDSCFGPDQPDAPDAQKLATALALSNRLTLISGGPGTGKTTTVVNLLACLLADCPTTRIALAAPTGKAAARMQEAIAARADTLPGPIRAALPTEALTLHRLLGLGGTGKARGPRYHREHPLPFDVVIVDEASMLDLAMATQLLEAVPDDARLILLGDKNQLAAVEPGAVFGALTRNASLSPSCRQQLASLTILPPPEEARSESTTPHWLTDCTVWLEKNYRFANHPGIGELARRINHHQGSEVVNWLQQAPCEEVCFQSLDNTAIPTTLWQAWLSRFTPMLVLARQARQPEEMLAAHTAFTQFRILCALRKGPRGTEAVNQMLSRLILRQAASLGLASEGDWFVGRPVMVMENDYRLGVFNGDIGLTLHAPEGGLKVFFPATDGSLTSIDPIRLPRHETAFAMTVHKSQGSEFDRIALLLPSEPSPVLTAELVYTAVTRAKKQVFLYGEAEQLAFAISHPTQRDSGL